MPALRCADRLRLERASQIARHQFVTRVDHDRNRRTLVCRDNLYQAGGVFAGHALLSARVKRTARDEILSDLETGGLASVDRQFVA